MSIVNPAGSVLSWLHPQIFGSRESFSATGIVQSLVTCAGAFSSGKLYVQIFSTWKQEVSCGALVLFNRLPVYFRFSMSCMHRSSFLPDPLPQRSSPSPQIGSTLIILRNFRSSLVLAADSNIHRRKAFLPGYDSLQVRQLVVGLLTDRASVSVISGSLPVLIAIARTFASLKFLKRIRYSPDWPISSVWFDWASSSCFLLSLLQLLPAVRCLHRPLLRCLNLTKAWYRKKQQGDHQEQSTIFVFFFLHKPLLLLFLSSQF